MADKPIIEQFADAFDLEFVPSSREESLGVLRFSKPEAFASLPFVHHLEAKGMLSYEQSPPGGYLELDVKRLDEEKIGEVLEKEAMRRYLLSQSCDEALEGGGKLSHLLGRLTGAAGNWVFDGITISASIPTGKNISESMPLEKVFQPDRPGVDHSVQFMLALKELEGRGAIKYHIDVEDRRVHITDASPTLLRQAEKSADLKSLIADKMAGLDLKQAATGFQIGVGTSSS